MREEHFTSLETHSLKTSKDDVLSQSGYGMHCYILLDADWED